MTRMEETTREANARVAAAEERARVAVAEADEAKRAELGTRAELDAARAARDALAADVRARAATPRDTRRLHRRCVR